MNATISPLVDHREELRVPANTRATFEAPYAVFAPSGPAMIEEISACGLRLRTESPLHPDEELVLKAAGEALPLHARVIWVRERPPLHLGGRRSWTAGCRLIADSIGRARIGPAVLDVRAVFPWRKMLLMSAALGAAGAAAYLLIAWLFARLGSALG